MKENRRSAVTSLTNPPPAQTCSPALFGSTCSNCSAYTSRPLMLTRTLPEASLGHIWHIDPCLNTLKPANATSFSVPLISSDHTATVTWKKKVPEMDPAAAHLWQTDEHVCMSSSWALWIARHPEGVRGRKLCLVLRAGVRPVSWSESLWVCVCSQLLCLEI